MGSKLSVSFLSSPVHTSPGGLNRNVFNMGRMWSTHAPWVHSWSNLWVFIAPTFHPGHHQRNSRAEALSPPFLLHQWVPQSMEMVQTETKSRMIGNEYVKGKTKPRGCHWESFTHVKQLGPPLHMKGQKEKKKKQLLWFINKMRINKFMRTPRSHVRFGELTKSFSIYGICLYVALLTSKLYFYLWGD